MADAEQSLEVKLYHDLVQCGAIDPDASPVAACALIDKFARKQFLLGRKDGIWRFAWWKDGVQYVGSCGTTLKKALEELDRDY